MKTISLLVALLALFISCSDDPAPVGEYSDDSLLKSIGQTTKAPFFITPDDPESGDEVTIEINIPGATTITFTITAGSGAGCGTLANTSGANPLTLTGTVGDRGYCVMEALADTGDVYEGRFEIEAESPDIPEIGLDSDIWDQDDLPVATAGDLLVIDSITGTDPIQAGSTNSFTMTYTGSENVVGIFMQVVDHPHGYFYAPVTGSGGSATFSVVVDTDATAASIPVKFVAVDDLNRFSAAFDKTINVIAALADVVPLADTAQTYTASGKVTFIKRLATRDGLEATGKYIPVKHATVKAISKADNTTVLATGATAEDGTYSLSFTNANSNKKYIVRVYTTSTSFNQSVVNLSGQTFAVDSAEVDGETTAAKTGLDIAITEANNAGAFNIWDIGVACNLYAKTATGTAPQALTFYWQKGSNKDPRMASYYQNTDGFIAMAGATADPDEYDDMVIGHEYGHFVMDKYSTDDSPGGSHTLQTPADPKLALSEGWATFFAGAALSKSEYIDTNADPTNTTYYTFETVSSEFPKGTVGSALTGNLSEILPNAVLWDLFDETNETKDTLKNNGQAIWKVLTTYLKSGYANFRDRGVEGRDLVDFLDGWICLGYGNVGSTDSEGLKGAAIGLVELPSTFVKSDLASCK